MDASAVFRARIEGAVVALDVVRGADFATVLDRLAGRAVFTQTWGIAALRYLTRVPRDRHVAGVGASAAVQEGGK